MVWLGLWNSDHVVLKLSIRSSALLRSVAVWLGFWNSVVWKSSILTSALPRRQESYRGQGLRVTQDAFFSLLTHTKQLLDKTAGSGVRFRTHWLNMDGWTDRLGSQNCYLDDFSFVQDGRLRIKDFIKKKISHFSFFLCSISILFSLRVFILYKYMLYRVKSLSELNQMKNEFWGEVNGLHNYKQSKLEMWKKSCRSARVEANARQPRFGSWTMVSSTKFDRPQLCSPLTYRD